MYKLDLISFYPQQIFHLAHVSPDPFQEFNFSFSHYSNNSSFANNLTMESISHFEVDPLSFQTEMTSHVALRQCVQIESMDPISRSTLIGKIQKILNEEQKQSPSKFVVNDVLYSTVSQPKRTSAYMENQTHSCDQYQIYSENQPKRKKTCRHKDLADIPKDGFHWRKYGQKQIKDSPNIRAYFACAKKNQGCLAKKMVDRKLHETFIRVSYEGEHNHEVPVEHNIKVASDQTRNPSASSDAPSGAVDNTEVYSFQSQLESDDFHFGNDPAFLPRFPVFKDFHHENVFPYNMANPSGNTMDAMVIPPILQIDAVEYFDSNGLLRRNEWGVKNVSKTESFSEKNEGNDDFVFKDSERFDAIVDDLWGSQTMDVEKTLFEVLESVTSEVEDILSQSAWQQFFDECFPPYGHGLPSENGCSDTRKFSEGSPVESTLSS